MKHSTLFRLMAALLIAASLFSLPLLAASDPIGDIAGGVIDGIQSGAQEAVDDLIDQLPDYSDLPIFHITSAEDANRYLDGFSAGVLLVMAGIALLVSLLGYRLLQLALSCGGFVGGWLIGMGIFSWLIGANIVPELATVEWYVPYIVYAVFGLGGSILAHKLIRTGLFISAAAGTFLFLGGISDLWEPLVDKIYPADTSLKYLIFTLIVSLIVGALTKWAARPVLIVTTAAAGGMIAAFAFMVCIKQTESTAIEMVIGLVLAVLGTLAQFGVFKKKRRKN